MFYVQEIILFKSTLTARGPVYEEIFKAQIAKIKPEDKI